MAKKPSEIIDRLMARSKKVGDCLEWTGKVDSQGYGSLRLAGYDKPRKYGKAHRLSYKNFFPEWDGVLSVLHKCDNRRCWNPDHLFLGTQKDNMHDMVAKGRSQKGSKHSQAKLTEEDVRSIRASILGSNALAKLYSISPSSVDQIRWGKTWRHVA